MGFPKDPRQDPFNKIKFINLGPSPVYVRAQLATTRGEAAVADTGVLTVETGESTWPETPPPSPPANIEGVYVDVFIDPDGTQLLTTFGAFGVGLEPDANSPFFENVTVALSEQYVTVTLLDGAATPNPLRMAAQLSPGTFAERTVVLSPSTGQPADAMQLWCAPPEPDSLQPLTMANGIYQDVPPDPDNSGIAQWKIASAVPLLPLWAYVLTSVYEADSNEASLCQWTSTPGEPNMCGNYQSSVGGSMPQAWLLIQYSTYDENGNATAQGLQIVNLGGSMLPFSGPNQPTVGVGNAVTGDMTQARAQLQCLPPDSAAPTQFQLWNLA